MYCNELPMVYTMVLCIGAVCACVLDWKAMRQKKRIITVRAFLYYVMNKYCALDWCNYTDV